MGALGLLGLWPVVTPAFGGEDPILGQDWHHHVITWRAARAAGWTTCGATANDDDSSAAASLAWHADYVDTYLYNPLWWAAGGLDRFKVAVFHHDELVKLHFDDLNSTRQVLLAWDRYLAGTVAGILWAARREDVPAARNITGVGLHALQDFYSHSNWVDDPQRRGQTWWSARGSGPTDPRAALHLYTGCYETAQQLAFKPHGKIALDCTAMRNLLPAALMDVLASPASILANTSIMQRWRECKTAVAPPAPDVLGVKLPKNVALVEPIGIALDNTWLTALAVKGPRDLPDRASIDPTSFFNQTRDLAVAHSAEWLSQLDMITTAAGVGEFWSRVKSAPRDAEQDRLQYEVRGKTPFGFVSAGTYPPKPDGSDEGWFLRLEIATAIGPISGTNADIYAEIDGTRHLLDHMHERTPNGDLGEHRILEYDDFQPGDRDSYLVGPLATLPNSLTLVNDDAGAGDVLRGAWTDLCRAVDGLNETLVDTVLSLVAGHADYIGWKSCSWDWATLSRMAAGGGPTTLDLRIDGGGEGVHRLRGVVDAVPRGEQLRVGVAITEHDCLRESGWDRGSDSDEPFFALSAHSPGASQSAWSSIGPLDDVDKDEHRDVDQGGHDHWWLLQPKGNGQQLKAMGDSAQIGGTSRISRTFTGSFTDARPNRTEVLSYSASDHSWWIGRCDGTTLNWTWCANSSAFGNLTRPAIRFFTGDFSGSGRTEVLFYCADDGNWWLARHDGTTLHWQVVNNSSAFGNLTRPAIRFFTGDFTGSGRAEVLFYCANDGNWWLGRGTGAELVWSHAGNTKGLGDLTRPAIRFFTGDFTGAGRTQVMLYCANKIGGWMTATYTGGQLQWAACGDFNELGDLTRPAIRMFTGDFTGAGRTQVLMYCANKVGGWMIATHNGSQLQWRHYGDFKELGDLTRPAVRFLVGDVRGTGHDQLLYYNAYEHRWRVAEIVADKLVVTAGPAWGGLGDITRADRDTLLGDFAGLGHSQILVRMPMLTVDVPRHGGFITAVQGWESDWETGFDRAEIARTFAKGVDSSTINQRSRFLDALGRACLSEWRVHSVGAVAFRRGSTLRYVDALPEQILERWIDGGKSLTIPFPANPRTTEVLVQLPVPATATPVPAPPPAPKPAPTPAPAPETAPASPSCHYRVRPGDTWWGIAQRLLGQGPQWQTLTARNPAVTALHPGDLVVIPWPAGEIVHQVPAGGTFWAAARAAYGTATAALVDQIISWNGGDKNRILKPGDVLHCPGTKPT